MCFSRDGFKGTVRGDQRAILLRLCNSTCGCGNMLMRSSVKMNLGGIGYSRMLWCAPSWRDCSPTCDSVSFGSMFIPKEAPLPLMQNQPIAGKSHNRCLDAERINRYPSATAPDFNTKASLFIKESLSGTSAHRSRLRNFSQPSPFPAALGLGLLLAASS